MKNYERYAEEIKGYKGNRFCADFIVKHIVKTSDCRTMDCDACRLRQMLWLLEEYKEPEIDWSKVEIDTPILVKNKEYENWRRRYFAAYQDGVVYAWVNGKTSWSENDNKEAAPWSYVELAESEEK